MPNQDTSELKNKIINFLRINGPSLPVHIAKEIGLSILFTSAFLSELLSERQLKISSMKIGSSKLHFLAGQENKLENFGYKVSEINGHDIKQLFNYFQKIKDNNKKPTALICHTVKGKGFHFAEDNPYWHHKNFRSYHGDLTDSSNLHSLISKIKPDEVYNLAAQSHVGVSFDG